MMSKSNKIVLKGDLKEKENKLEVKQNKMAVFSIRILIEFQMTNS